MRISGTVGIWWQADGARFKQNDKDDVERCEWVQALGAGLGGWDRRVRVVVGVRGRVAVVVGIKSPGRGQGIHRGLDKHLDLD